ncbi:MAG: hypothetical protein HWN65_04135 [Candidatus Helarchaeota archaeon]|nr:hypothetical protein [Candidatus Helarchaeota archaeon]
MSIVIFVPPATADVPDNALVAKEALTIPTLDGVLSPDEWDDAQRYDFYFDPAPPHPADDITILLKHDGTHLFIALDVRPDNTTELQDSGFVWLDLDNNGTKDIEIGVARGGSHDSNHYFGGSSEAIYGLHYVAAFGFTTTAQEPTRIHTVIEISISIDQTVAYTGQSLLGTTSLPFQGSPVGVVFGGYGTMNPEWFAGNTTDIDMNDIWKGSALNATFYSDLYLTYNPTNPLLIVLIILFPVIGVALGVLIYYRRREIL